MIKIDVDERIWKDIKKEHFKWYEEKILPNIEKACKFLESKKNKDSSVEIYLDLLKKIRDKGGNFVVNEIKKSFEYEKEEEEFYKVLFNKSFVKNLKKDLKNDSKCYKYNILPKIEKAYEFLESKKNKGNSVEKYLDLLKKTRDKGENFVVNEIKNSFKEREEEKKFYKDLFNKSFVKNLKKDLKNNSKWYKENILPKIEETCEFLKSKEDKSNSLKEYLDKLEKIKKEKKDFEIEKKFDKDLIKRLKEMDLPKEYLPNKLFIYKEYLPNKLFHYEKLYKGNWNRHELLSLMGIEVCPYCQRNYISNYEDYEENNKKMKTKKTTAHLDHFYPKADYPFLALSLYNFIPSCQVCNSVFKKAKEVQNSIYLYEEGFEELGVKFRTSGKVINEILGEKNSDFSVEIDCKNIEDKEKENKVRKSIDNLGLDRVYEKSHNQYIQDLLYTVEKYPENYLEACGEMFENNKGKKEQLKEYFKDIVKEPYRKRIENEEPLAKLTKDILEEFNIKI